MTSHDAEALSSPYDLHWTAETPAAVTSLGYSRSKHIFAGASDGSLRVYSPASSKVLKAVRGLKDEISSVICLGGNETQIGRVWLACGRRIYHFSIDSGKAIQTGNDAFLTLELGVDDEDALNELAVNMKHDHLAFTSDSGVVGVVELSTQKVTRMKTKHENISLAVKFIPDRPSELVSGGCDSALLHFDFQQASQLSRHNLAAAPPDSNISLSPPFILCLSVSPSGIIAAGTADARLWIGTGGEKSAPGGSAGKKKRKRKWEGLQVDAALLTKIAEGPIVAVTFTGPRELLSCTLLGKMMHHEISGSAANGDLKLTTSWTREMQSVVKVNALMVLDDYVVIGGCGKSGKGVVEILERRHGNADNVPLQQSNHE